MGGGEGEATPAFQFPRKDLAGDRAVCRALRGPFGLPPHHLPTTLVMVPLGLTGQDPSRAGSHTGQRHPNINTEGSPGSWALLSVAPGQPGRSTLRWHSHTGQARLPSQWCPEAGAQGQGGAEADHPGGLHYSFPECQGWPRSAVLRS